MVKSKSLRKKRGGNKGGQKRADKFPNIQINIDGGGFFDELKNAFGLNPISENTEKVIDPEKSKRFSENLQKAMEAGIEEKRAKNELKSEEMIAKNEMKSKEMIAKNEMKSKEKDQNFMKDMMDKMNQSNLEQSRIHKEERENLKKLSSLKIGDISNISINETLSRTIITSITTLLALFSIFILGGEILRGFALAMIIGVLIGTYSSIFIAVPTLLVFKFRPQDEDEN